MNNRSITYFLFEGAQISHITMDGKKPCCGSKVRSGYKKHQVKMEDEEIKELWPDIEKPKGSWVTMNEYEYCKRCVQFLKKNNQ